MRPFLASVVWSLLVVVGCARDRLPHTVVLPEAGPDEGHEDDAALADFGRIEPPPGGAWGKGWAASVHLRPTTAAEVPGGGGDTQGESAAEPLGPEGGGPCFDFEGCQEHALHDGCLLVCDVALSWLDAATACMEIDGRLALPTTAAVNHMLRPAVGGRRWIGMSDLDEEGRFRDLGGQSEGWSNWSAGEPNNQGDEEDCAEMLPTGRWNDARCDRVQPFACDLVPFQGSEGP